MLIINSECQYWSKQFKSHIAILLLATVVISFLDIQTPTLGHETSTSARSNAAASRHEAQAQAYQGWGCARGGSDTTPGNCPKWLGAGGAVVVILVWTPSKNTVLPPYLSSPPNPKVAEPFDNNYDARHVKVSGFP